MTMTQGVAVTPRQVVETARSYMGVRWLHQGRTRRGLDCAGLVVVVAHELGLTSFDTASYGRMPEGGRLRALLREHCHELPGLAPRLGLLALMKFAAEPQHLAIVGDYPLGGFSLVHALTHSRRVVEHRFDAMWSGRLVSLYELPGVAYEA